MADSFNFEDLFVFDLANNHQGSVEHGTRIINEIGDVATRHGVRGAIKFQFRQLDSFLHPDHQQSSDNKHIPRFISTRLLRDGYEKLLERIHANGMISTCTPFDEESVDEIVDMGFDIIKIASCSVTDWPLIEKISETNKPVIFSTGGVTMKEIDDLESFLAHRGVDFAIMHCVSIYPTPNGLCNLSNIETLRHRYRDRVIGWSTHEDPNETAPVQVAYAKGARMFERHVGIETDDIKLNLYSSTPAQIDKWLSAHHEARTLCGSAERQPPHEDELAAIESLQRGVFASKSIKPGTEITRDQVYFAMPWRAGQLPSSLWRQGMTASAAVEADGPLMQDDLDQVDNDGVQVLKTAIHEVKAMLNEARIALNSDFVTEYSHHYGIRKFRETGAVLINCINRDYCKKLIVQLPGQHHPSHFHRLKEETFQILSGELHCDVGGKERTLHPGDTVLIQPGVFHSFWSETGAIFEEISTTDNNGDSFYRDKQINAMKREDRKTIVDHWGRFQLQQATEGKA